ncbi:hypothetical protein Hanom_Chr04g00334041 [Helianthus anomalus]
MFYKRNNQIITSKRNPKHPLRFRRQTFNSHYTLRDEYSVWALLKLIATDKSCLQEQQNNICFHYKQC